MSQQTPPIEPEPDPGSAPAPPLAEPVSKRSGTRVFFRTLLRVSLWTLILTVSLPLLSLALLQLQPVQERLTAAIESALGREGGRIHVQGLSGTLPFHPRLRGLELADDDGVWLRAEGLRFSWLPMALFDGRLQLPEISATRIVLLRPPRDGSDDAPPLDPSLLLQRVTGLPPVIIDRLRVEHLELRQPVLGQAADFHLDGRVRLSQTVSRPAALSLEARLDRQDRSGASLRLNGRLRLHDGDLSLDLSLEEESGLAAAIFGGGADEKLQLTLKGAGPPTAWQGDLRLSWPDWGVTASRVGLDFSRLSTADPQAELNLNLDGRWRPPAALLPPELKPLVDSGSIPFVFKGGVEPGLRWIDLTELAITGRDVGLKGSGRLDLEKRDLLVDLAARTDRSERFSQLAGQPLSGPLTLRATLSGPLDRPRAALTLESPELGIGDARIHGLDVVVRAHPPVKKEPFPIGMALTVVGRTGGVRLPDAVQKSLPPLEPRFDLQVRVADGKSLVFDRLELKTGDQLQVTGQGTWNPENQDAVFQVRMRTGDVAPLLVPLELSMPIRGAAAVAGEVRLLETFQRIDFQGMITGDTLAGWPAPADELLGRRPSLQVDGSWRRGKRVDLPFFKLAGAGIDARGTAKLDLGREEVAAELSAELKNLARLSGWAGQKLSGTARLTVDASGSLERPEIKLQLHSDGLSVAEQRFRQVRFKAGGADLIERPRGDFALALSQPGGRVTIDGTFERVNQSTLHLGDLRLQGPGTVLSGALELDLERGLSTGRLQGASGDLAALKGWHGQALSGSAELDFSLTSGIGDLPRGHLLATFSNLTGTFGAIERLRVRTNAGLEGERWQVDGELELQGFRQPEMRVERLAARFGGGSERVNFTTELSGAAPFPFQLQARGEAGQRPEGFRLAVRGLTGTIDREPVTLNDTLVVEQRGERFQAEPLDLDLAGIHVQGYARKKAGTIDVKLAGNGDLKALNTLNIHPLQGDFLFDLTVRGAAAAPGLAGRMTMTQVSSSDPDMAGLPPVDLTADLVMRNGRGLDIQLVSSGLSKGPLQGRSTLPLRLGFEPMVFEWSQEEPIAASMKADLDLAKVALWTGLGDDQRLIGLARVDLGAAGTMDRPRLNGTVTLEGGTFEQADTGTHLQGVNLLLRGVGDALVLERFHASDGGQGSIDGSGRFSLDPGRGFPLQLRLKLDRAVLVRLNEALVELQGDLRLDRGDDGNLRATGTMTVNRGELLLTDIGGPDITVIELEGEPMAGGSGEEAANAGVMADLDIKVQVPGRMFLRGRGLESEWRGGFDVTGSTLEPVIVGKLQIKRGQLDFLDHRFQLRTGVIRFEGSSPPEPVVNLEAAAQGDTVLAIVSLTGTISKPRFSFTSEPELPQGEVLSHLLFGRTSDSITPSQAIKLAAALEAMRSGEPGIMSGMQRGLGFDRLDFIGDSMETGSVNVGKYLTDTLYMEVEKGLKADDGRLKIQKELTPEFSLEVGVNSDSNADMGLNWKRNY